MRAWRQLGSDICTRRRGRWALTVLLLASVAHAAMPAPARAVGYRLAPGSTFEPSGAPPGDALPLTGSFDLAAWGVCPLPCEPNAYWMMNVVLSTGGDLLSSGVVELIHGGLVISGPAFEVLPDDSVQTGLIPIERTIIETGILTDDPHNHTDYETFVERSLGILLFVEDDPREVIYSDPRGTWPIELTLAYTLIEKTGTAHFGWDGTGSIYVNEIVDSQSEVLGYTTFSAHPIPEPSIDIKPGSDPNPINPFSAGIIPVAVLGSDTFDVADVDVTTLAFGPDEAMPAHKQGGHFQDVNDDGLTDLLSHYRTEETGIASGDTEACVTGETLDGIPLQGCDSINTQPPCGNGYAAALVVPPLVWIGGRRRRRKS